MTYTTIRVERDERGLVHIVLDRPERRNAFNDTMLRELDACVRDLNDDPTVRVVAVSGSGGHFSAGRDRAELAGIAARDSARPVPPSGGYESSMFRALEMPTIALLDGAVVGGSLGFALQCDLRIATTRARFIDGHLPNGVAPSVAVWYLPRLIGTGRALRLCAGAEPLPATEALALGLVDAVVEPSRLTVELERFAAGFLAADPQLVRHTKALLRYAQEASYEDAMRQVGLMRALERARRTR
jgi:enoyl-CoA hydratase/carnithine racemase